MEASLLALAKSKYYHEFVSYDARLIFFCSVNVIFSLLYMRFE